MVDSQQKTSTWSPLQHGLFRGVWIAALVSNIGTWIQDVGVVWLMTSLAPTPIMVSLAQTALNLPYFFLALPAGALADVVDRRRLLLFAELWMFCAALVLGGLTIAGMTTPTILLSLTFVIGMGAALNAPTYQAITPDLVPRSQLPAAVALNSVGLNLARAIGPAIGGFIIAAAGPGTAFVLNGLSFLGMMTVIYQWKRSVPASLLPAERFWGAMRAGIRFVRHATPFRFVLIRAAAFILFGSAFWAFLPLLVRFEMQRGPVEYGLLLGCFGLGAVGGAMLVPALKRKMSLDTLILGATLSFATMLVLLTRTTFYWMIPEMMIGGASWLVLLASFNTSAQAAVPAWVRGRALAVYLLVFFGGMAIGSAAWGGIASLIGLHNSLVSAAVSMVLGLVFTRRYPLAAGETLDLTPSMHWATPPVVNSNDIERGPVVVSVEYRIDLAKRKQFVQAIQDMRRLRLRDGALWWQLLNDTTEPTRVLEVFFVEAWVEHLRQHERVTNADRETEERARAFHQGNTPPVVTHYIVDYWHK